MQELGKLTRTVDGRPRIISDPPLLVPAAELMSGPGQLAAFAAQLGGVITQYQRTLVTDRRFLLDQFQFCDMARKVVGWAASGSVAGSR